MIHLDTNYLIALVAASPSKLKTNLRDWLTQDEGLAVSAVVWSEFLNGPVTAPHVRDAARILQGRIIPFGISEAELSAVLFNRSGRRRGSQPDCFIAATAICAHVPLATVNMSDFRPFIPTGLQLV